MPTFNLFNNNCLEEMKNLPENSVDSIVTDPPYGLSFMGKKWDYDVPSVEIWGECLRILKPGGHLLAFAGTRTQHRMAVNIEDAGFEIRDMIAWVYGSGFPKSMNVSKAIDKAAGAEREVVGKREHPTLKDKTKVDRKSSTQHHGNNSTKDEWDITAPATDDAKKWDGWGTALKPALEPITVARKPLEEKTIVRNVLKYGTGAINIDESRVPIDPESDKSQLRDVHRGVRAESESQESWGMNKDKESVGQVVRSDGRFPANLIHDGSEEVTELFPYSKSTGGKTKSSFGDKYGTFSGESLGYNAGGLGDEGTAARFFYCAKASKKDRNEGVEKNNHPTVKPTDLMRYLVRMVTPKDGVVLDPFMGSGTTGKAAMLEGFDFIGIEMDEDYFRIAEKRIEHVTS